MRKLIALTMLVIPVLIAGVGIKLMRDSMFGIINDPFNAVFLQFLIGLVIFGLGTWFIAGYIINRERKHKRLKESIRKRSTDSK